MFNHQMFRFINFSVAFGCATHIQLPVADPDGDILRCRWADVTECRGACTNPPKNAVRLRKVGFPVS